ncbi:IS30 family transposase/molybdenum-dependent DNA-binding transcriptional regulator ModE [Arthrobacter silviterrae]|nr:IS30 family transposase/molybdenum-dependent DNA-binding transcriptional regulator ModE [Arthrobacter silviterrae]
MDSPSINDAFLTKKSPPGNQPIPSGSPALKRAYRHYSAADRTEFFAAFERLGSIPAAARELGFTLSTCRAWAGPSGRESGQKYTQSQKDEFFIVLDRVGSVSAAAKVLGINVQTCFHWAYKAGAVTRRPRANPVVAQPSATQEHKDVFFTVLARVGSISVAARELGLPKSRCTNWARNAGIKSIHPGVAKRAEYFRLREAGVGRKEAAAAAGASRKSGYLWENERDRAKDRAVSSESLDLPYKQEVKTTFPEPASTDTAPSAPAALPPAAAPRAAAAPEHALVALRALEQVVSARYLSLAERERIADMYGRGESMRAIARALGRSPGSISREIKRNSHPTLGYQPYGAHRTATASRARPKISKLAAAGELRDYVEEKLRVRWSPEQISKLLIKEFPHDGQMRVSHETIYQSLYFQARGGLKREVKEALRTGRTRRKKHKSPEERTSRFRDPMINISERPPEAEDRAIPGHWEGDLITGTSNQSAIATLVERTTRYVMLVHLPIDHSAESVRDGLIKTMSTLPAHLRGSLTWDQGVEMAKHKAFSIATDMDVYFCDPHSPWQRGTNENTNGLLRQYFPKGTDLGAYGPEDLEHVAQELNARPRKTLNWNTPAESLRDLLIAS